MGFFLMELIWSHSPYFNNENWLEIFYVNHILRSSWKAVQLSFLTCEASIPNPSGY